MDDCFYSNSVNVHFDSAHCSVLRIRPLCCMLCGFVRFVACYADSSADFRSCYAAWPALWIRPHIDFFLVQLKEAAASTLMSDRLSLPNIFIVWIRPFFHLIQVEFVILFAD